MQFQITVREEEKKKKEGERIFKKINLVIGEIGEAASLQWESVGPNRNKRVNKMEESWSELGGGG